MKNLQCIGMFSMIGSKCDIAMFVLQVVSRVSSVDLFR